MTRLHQPPLQLKPSAVPHPPKRNKIQNHPMLPTLYVTFPVHKCFSRERGIPMTRKQQVLELLNQQPGLSDREITDRLLGTGKPQQPIFAITRELTICGLIVRKKRPDGIFGNYPLKYVDRTVIDKSKPPKLKPRRTLPPEALFHLRKAGEVWALSDDRPRLSPDIKAYWSAVIKHWSVAQHMPLIVRKSTSSRRGTVVAHKSGREIIYADNSPAQWVFDCARKGQVYSLKSLEQLLNEHKIPILYAASQSELEQMTYGGVLAKIKVDLNREGWKLCHIEGVSSRTRTKPEDDSLDNLKKHFTRLMDPANHFVVPKHWSGFGELPEVIEAIKEFDNRQT
jgi:hypothetical protein